MNAVAETVGLAAFAPPHRLPHADELPLGARVRFHHRAAVARWTTYEHGPGEWRLTEGVERGWRPAISPPERDPRDIEFSFADDPFYRRRSGRTNKTVIVWPEEGDGFLFGLVRRGIGEGYSPSGGYDHWTGEHEYDPGGFSAQALVPLYAIKTGLNGVRYLLCPTWAVYA